MVVFRFIGYLLLWLLYPRAAKRAPDNSALSMHVEGKKIEVQPGCSAIFMPRSYVAYDGVRQGVRMVGSPIQWIKRREIFLDVFTPLRQDAAGWVLVAVPTHGKLVRLNVAEQHVALVKPWCFLGAMVESLKQIRLKSYWFPIIELLLHGVRAWYVVRGPAVVYAWVHESAVLVTLHPQKRCTLVPRAIAAVVGRSLRQQLLWNGWTNAWLRRTPTLKELTAQDGPAQILVSVPAWRKVTQVVRQGSDGNVWIDLATQWVTPWR